MLKKFPDFAKAHILVVGDVMLDSYFSGNTTRISPEAPVPVVHVQHKEKRAGGAANVALNAAALGGNVEILALVGNDADGDYLEKILQAAAITVNFQRIANAPTINKLRVIGRSQQLIRLDFEEKFQPTTSEKSDFLQKYQVALSKVNVVIFSDYGKGTLDNIQNLIALARAQNKLVLVDPKGKEFTIYSGATLITPNCDEFEAIVGSCRDETEIAQKAQTLRRECNLANILVTRGAHGMSLMAENAPPLHIPTYAREVYDVTGAGDTVIATLGVALAAEASLEDALHLANSAAGVVVRKIGTATVSLAELRRAIQRYQHAPEVGMLSEAELLEEIKDARAHHEKIVFTNGCFDILHAGHVKYLEAAKNLGQRLVIGVNTDASVQKLKGAARPINKLADRMLLLTALRAVDWVVPFDDDTPERLIKIIRPDVLVKGGDYTIDKIVGADFVLKNGGEVKIIPFVDGLSTSNVLKKLSV